MECRIRAKLTKEMNLGRGSGPQSHTPLPNLRISSLGVVPQKNPGEFRLFHHLSYPHGDLVNDAIDPAIYMVIYASFDATTDMISLGP